MPRVDRLDSIKQLRMDHPDFVEGNVGRKRKTSRRLSQCSHPEMLASDGETLEDLGDVEDVGTPSTLVSGDLSDLYDALPSAPPSRKTSNDDALNRFYAARRHSGRDRARSLPNVHGSAGFILVNRRLPNLSSIDENGHENAEEFEDRSVSFAQ